MKKYHLADALTLTEFILTGVLIILTFLNVSADIVIWIFIVAELCDAFDGICARRWHYPNDNKKRWWRDYASQIDQLTDILLILACAVYITWRISWTFGLGITVPVGIFCIVVQIFTLRRENERLILIRRFVYVAVIAAAIIKLVFATSWPDTVKEVVLSIGTAAGIILAIVKRNRLSQSKTPLD